LAPLANENVGMVTCLYHAIAGATVWSKLESLSIGTDFCPGVLAARQLEGIRFGLGSTMAFRRGDLEKIGGFESFVDYLADDYELGKRIAALGRSVELSDVVVATNLPAYEWRGFFSHQMRWARGVRDSRPGGYFGLPFTFGVWWAILVAAAACGAGWAWGLFGVIFFLRLVVAFVVGRNVLHDKQLARQVWLLPLRDLIAVFIWAASFFGHTVSWRGDRFDLKNGKLIRISV
jgi:ceramide glucosyltransferase